MGHFFNNIAMERNEVTWICSVGNILWPDEPKNFLIFEANDLPGMGLSSYNSESICLVYKYSFQLINLVFTVQIRFQSIRSLKPFPISFAEFSTSKTCTSMLDCPLCPLVKYYILFPRANLILTFFSVFSVIDIVP